MEDRGRLAGRMKFAGEGTYPNALVVLGMEKSFISSFMIIPLDGTMTCDPNRRFIVEVMVTASPVWSAVLICDVPCAECDSRPEGLYADTLRVWASEILERISRAVVALSMVKVSKRVVLGTKAGSPRWVLYTDAYIRVAYLEVI